MSATWKPTVHFRLFEQVPQASQRTLFGSMQAAPVDVPAPCDHAGDRQEQERLDGRVDVVCCSCATVVAMAWWPRDSEQPDWNAPAAQLTLSADWLERELAHCNGSDNWYRTAYGFTYTDGVQTLIAGSEGVCYDASHASGGAYWLLDLIGSYQPQCRRDPMLRDFQIWRVRVVEDGDQRGAIVTCERDTDDVAISQSIEFTDFPLLEVKLYLEGDVLMLPSER